MFRRKLVPGTVFLPALVAICHGCAVDLLAAPIRSGDKVVATNRAAVVKGENTLLYVNPGTQLTALSINGNWVGVETEQAGRKITGWIHQKYLATEKGKAAGYPRELAMQSLPAYRIEPPDLLQIEMLKQVPVPPYRVEKYDVLQIEVIRTLPDAPIVGPYMVEGDGTIDLGSAYGAVRVVGMTIEEAREVITQKLLQTIAQPVVSARLAKASGTQPVTGQYLVSPDGTVNLRQYGAVDVAGKTIVEAKQALKKHLSQYFDSPDVTVDVLGYNSKVYYVITESAKLGDSVARLPITGKETVLDAISHVGGLSAISSRKIWVVRPTFPGSGKEIVLPVDWEAITRRGATATNYQLFPGDRVYIEGTKPSR